MAHVRVMPGHTRTLDDFYYEVAEGLIDEQTHFNRGEWQSKKEIHRLQETHEVRHVTFQMGVNEYLDSWQKRVAPNLPWAEDHFQERVSGIPHNPPPSHEWWPYAQKNNDDHRSEEKFSHTYPERFWPRHANQTQDNTMPPFPARRGIRYEFGDLNDLCYLLASNPNTRQAYLPVWFPEDLYAAADGQRVPCTLGYHFLRHPSGALDMTYHIRSCDLVRHFRDDVYMAGRLLQWVCARTNLKPGVLVMNIGSFHCFHGDVLGLKVGVRKHRESHMSNIGKALS